MPVDALTMAAVGDELRDKVIGGRIQGVFLPAPLAIGLEIYRHGATHFLFASAHPQHARVHLSQSKLSRGTEDITPLLLLLRKYVRDGRLAAVEQPALERTLSLIITKADVFGKGHGSSYALDAGAGKSASAPAGDDREKLDLTTVTMIVEVMGRYSNIILVDDTGHVVEAVKHIGADINRYRVTLPRHPYVAPPPQNKEDPRGVSTAALERVLAAAGEQPAWQTLVRAYLGVSPLLAREAVFRCTGSSSVASGQIPAAQLSATLAHLLNGQHTHHWSPTIAREGDSIIDFAPYELTQFGADCSAVDSISAAIHAYYAQETVASDYAGLKQQVQKLLDMQRDRVLRRKASLHKQETVGREAEVLRAKGELLLAFSSQIAPGQHEVSLSFSPDEAAVRIALEPRLSVVENAQEYFQRYTQARDAARSIPPLLDRVNLDLAYLDQLQHDLAMAASASDVLETQRALAEAGPERQQDESAKKGAARPVSKLPPFTFKSSDGMDILVGRNARQNDYVTFELGVAGDVWLHARGVPGSHVIIRALGRPVSQKTIQEAAALAAAHSGARESATVAVSYTQRRNVHRARGGGPGMVTYSGEKTIHARPAAPLKAK